MKIQVRGLITMMFEKRIPEAQMPDMIRGFAKGFGLTAHNVPSRAFCQEVLREMAVGAKAEMCAQILRWHAENPQTLGFIGDGVSIGEWKGFGVAIVKKVANGQPPKKRKDGKLAPLGKTARKEARKAEFQRVGLGIIHLASSTDEAKQLAIQELLQDCVDCFNAVLAPEYGREISVYDLVKTFGNSVNDHGETVIGNKFLPWAKATIEKEIGSAEQIKTILLILQRKRLKASVAKYLLEKTYGPDVTNILRRKLAENAFFCWNHKNCLVEDACLKGMLAVEEDHADLCADKDEKRRTQTLVENFTWSAGKFIANGKKHETLTHLELFASCRALDDQIRLRFERITGTRGKQAVFGNAENLLRAFTDKGEYGALAFIAKLTGCTGNSNRLYDSLRTLGANAVVLAELRVCAILNQSLFRTVQTFCQSHADQDEMVKVKFQYTELLDKMAEGPLHPRDLPWLDADRTILLDAGRSEKVLHQHTVIRRKSAIEFLLNPPFLTGAEHAEARALQDKLMAEMIHKAGIEMRNKLCTLTGTKYNGSIFDLDADDPRRQTAKEASATSDPIERIFGVASYLRCTNPNQTRENTDNHMAVIDRQFGTHLLDLCATDPERAELMTARQRRYAPTYAKTLADRKKKTAVERKEILDAQAQKDKEKAAAAKAELQRLRQLAETWRTDIQQQFSGRNTRRAVAKPLDEQLAKVGTDAERRSLLHDYLKMMTTVHFLHRVKTLRSIFFSASDRAAILTQDGKKVSTNELKARLARCACYLAGPFGSPAGVPV